MKIPSLRRAHLRREKEVWHCFVDALEVCAELGIDFDAAQGKRRKRATVAARRALAHALRKYGYGWRTIGRVLRRDHASVINLVAPKTKKEVGHDEPAQHA